MTQLLPPRVVIVMADQWRRALLRAALRDVGYDAIGTRGIRESAVIRSSAPGRGPVRLIIVDQDALGTQASRVTSLQERLGNAEILLLARATVSPPDGPWRQVLRRPFTIEDVVQAVQRSLPLPAKLQHAIDESAEE